MRHWDIIWTKPIFFFFKKLPESQNSWDWEGCWKSSGVTSVLKAGSSRPGYLGLYPLWFWLSPRMEAPLILWAACCSIQSPLQLKKLFCLFVCFLLYLNGISCISNFAHCFSSNHRMPQRRVWLCLLPFFSIRFLYTLFKPSCLQAKQSWRSQTLV